MPGVTQDLGGGGGNVLEVDTNFITFHSFNEQANSILLTTKVGKCLKDHHHRKGVKFAVLSQALAYRLQL